MYNLKEAYDIIGPGHQHGLWEGRYACGMGDAPSTSLTNPLADSVACYSFTLVLQGEVTLQTNGHVIPFRKNDLYIYLPGLQTRIVSVSDDYRSNVLIVDEKTTFETKAFRNLTRASFYPIVQYGKPKLMLTPNDAERLNADMLSIHDHIHRPTLFSNETLDMLYSVFLLDMIDIQEHAQTQLHVSRRTEDIFLSFYTLLRKHCIEHHDIGFYADRLNVTTTYLSRIVKQLTNHTVMEYINQMLVTEAIWLLTSTDLTVNQIADRLHFATTASFDKFFLRMSGKIPKDYRRR